MFRKQHAEIEARVADLKEQFDRKDVEQMVSCTTENQPCPAQRTTEDGQHYCQLTVYKAKQVLQLCPYATKKVMVCPVEELFFLTRGDLTSDFARLCNDKLRQNYEQMTEEERKKDTDPPHKVITNKPVHECTYDPKRQ